jgi:UDP-2,4-diacetamido-2,4,6-trideoxy-beta-L-altropyranose hydrolase
MRCLALAQAWQDAGGNANLATAEMPDALIPRLIAEGVAVSGIDATPGGLDDAHETVARAKRLRADWVAIDGDRFGSDFLEFVRNAGFHVLLIDDFAKRESYPVDLIVNPNLDDTEGAYGNRFDGGRALQGPAYVLLRREFTRETENTGARQNGRRILVTLGGSDPECLTPEIVSALVKSSDLALTVIAGAGYERQEELQSLSAHNLRVLFNPPNMVDLMKGSDQAIIAAGGTLWELLFIGCAVLSYSRNDVQRRVVEALSQRSIVADMGDTREFDPERLVASVQELAGAWPIRERMTSLGRAMVDGLGPARIVEAVLRSGAHRWL